MDPTPPDAETPLVVAVDMGYGHLRAAHALADALGTEVRQVDRPPLVAPAEAKVWGRARAAYEAVSRLSQVPLLGAPLQLLLDGLTDIPRLHPYRDLSAPTRGVLTLDRLVRRNLGQGMMAELQRDRGAAPDHLLLARAWWPTGPATTGSSWW